MSEQEAFDCADGGQWRRHVRDIGDSQRREEGAARKPIR
jgi:hypothetical protein